ncbi:ectodysplasin-A receptor-associated adapter protein [Protopterus annectens]|uniref:ectodysplasin-A receptor-associated adapter protein n=1 Tax=Protopterus annectens TaxID=7888 RepID=UPI001CFB6EC5|nr:ectodysplasin-A receptor-associated adapter protein [Protopterus annectens]
MRLSIPDQSCREPVEDTDTSYPSTDMLSKKCPVQDSASQKDNDRHHASTITMGFSDDNINSLVSDSERIRQPEDDDCTKNITSLMPSDELKTTPCPVSSTDNCTCKLSSDTVTDPLISDLLNDEDLLYELKLKLDTSYSTVKNWRNFASKWGMTYDELCYVQQKQQSPTEVFLTRNSEKTVEQLIELCIYYKRVDVQKVLLKWVAEAWPMRQKDAL